MALEQRRLGGEEEAGFPSELIRPFAHVEPVTVDHHRVGLHLPTYLHGDIESVPVMEWIEFVCIVVLAIPNLRVRQDDGATAYTPAPELLLSFWSEKLNTDLSILFAEGDRFEILFWLAVTTGLRQGELVGIKWSDVDWPNRRLRIQRQLQRLHGGLAFSEPKSAAGRRVIALGVATIEKLRKHQRLQLVEIQVAGKFWKENDMIFPSSKGTPMDPSNLYHNFKRLLVEAGLPNIRFHDLRYTAVTLMLQQGIHPKVVQERLGHSDISMTLNTYSHVLPVMQDDAAEKLDDLLTPINVSDEIKNLVESKFWYVPPAENDSGRRRLENR